MEPQDLLSDDSQFSSEFIEYTNQVANQLATRGDVPLNDDEIQRLAQALGSYQD